MFTKAEHRQMKEPCDIMIFFITEACSSAVLLALSCFLMQFVILSLQVSCLPVCGEIYKYVASLEGCGYGIQKN